MSPSPSLVQFTADNRELLSEAKRLLKISKRKDYYKVLGISKEATDNEIKKAYRKKALQHHPGVCVGGGVTYMRQLMLTLCRLVTVQSLLK